MKTALFLTVLLIAVNVMARDIQQENNYQIIAASGCCKQKTSNGWRIISRDYNRCQELNSRYDNRDDIYSSSGTIWWDSSC